MSLHRFVEKSLGRAWNRRMNRLLSLYRSTACIPPLGRMHTKKTPHQRLALDGVFGQIKTGDYLLSRLVSTTIGATGLTAVFGMGTGVAPLLWAAGILLSPRISRGEHKLLNSGKGFS